LELERDCLADIFEEIVEDLRAERAKRALLRYGGVGAIIVVVLVGAAAGWQGWRWYQQRQDQAAGAVFLAAMHDADSVAPAGEAVAVSSARTAAEAGFEHLALTAPEGYRTLARLRDAALKADAGDLAGAALLWDQVASDPGADKLLRDLATLLWADHQLSTADPGTLRTRLAPLTVPTNAWHALAQETQALVDLREGRDDSAKQALHALVADSTAPEGVRNRATGLLARLGG
jgi:hypothetical protein